jgi:hypothetical protein
MTRLPKQPFNLEYILFSYLVTPQKQVGKPGLKKYENLDPNCEMPPIEVLPLENGEYAVFDGNHRARAEYDKGEPGIWAYVLLDRNYRLEKPYIRISELEIVDYEISSSPTPQCFM